MESEVYKEILYLFDKNNYFIHRIHRISRKTNIDDTVTINYLNQFKDMVNCENYRNDKLEQQPKLE